MAQLVTADPPASLAAGFPEPSFEAWRALVAKALKGAGPESLVTRGPDGLAIEPLYLGRATSSLAPGARRARAGDAGPWDIRCLVDHPNIARANADLLEDFAGGASSALLVLDPAAERGVAVGSADDLARLLEGVLLEVAPIGLDAGFQGVLAAEWLAGAAKASPAAPLAFHLDPLSAFAAGGFSPGAIEAHLSRAARLAADLADTYPNATLFLASGRAVHEAGGRPADEIAFALAAALAYAKAMAAVGLRPETAFSRIVLGLGADADILVSIAKLRAARIVWAKLVRACGAQPTASFEARSSRRMLTRADAWTNLVRLVLAGFSAVAGGADAVVLDPFTAALGTATPMARRMARDAQLILMEEAHIGAVEDPLAGAGAIEALSDDLARQAWSALREIEAAGGLIEALRAGHVASRVAEGRAALRTALAEGALHLVGITDFVSPDAPGPEVDSVRASPVSAPDPRQPGPDSLCPGLAPVSLEDLAADGGFSP